MSRTEQWGKYLKDIETGETKADIPNLYETACDMHTYIYELEEARDNACNDCDMWRSKCKELEKRNTELFDMDTETIDELQNRIAELEAQIEMHSALSEHRAEKIDELEARLSMNSKGERR